MTTTEDVPRRGARGTGRGRQLTTGSKLTDRPPCCEESGLPLCPQHFAISRTWKTSKRARKGGLS